MNLSKKSRYGITALIDLAVYAKDQCVQLSSIAERNNISVKYLEQIFSSLRKSGLVRSVKGTTGRLSFSKKTRKYYRSRCDSCVRWKLSSGR